jgi:hypothetical protein
MVALSTWRKNGCCEVTLSWSECCRNFPITTGAANQNFYIEAKLNICQDPCDNSPVFMNTPIAIICQGRDFIYNQGVQDMDIDPNTGGLADSLVYSWAEPMKSASSKTTWSSGYAYNKPLYYLGFPKTGLAFPRGINLDSATGDLMFRPMKVEQTVMAIKIESYRNGKLTALTRRDIQVVVIKCPDNYSPVLSGINCNKPTFDNFTVPACAGEQLCFTVCTSDKDSLDTVTIGWNSGIPEATFTVLNQGDKWEKALVCWTPDYAHVSINPYNLVILAKDNNCPVPGTVSRVFNIYVSMIPKFSYDTVGLDCGKVRFVAKPSKYSYTWSFDGSGRFDKATTGDSVDHAFPRSGKQAIGLRVTDGGGCRRDTFDSVLVPKFINVAVEPKILSNCAATGKAWVRAAVSNPTGSYKAYWGTGKTFTDQGGGDSIALGKEDTITVMVDDGTCRAYDTSYVKDYHPFRLSDKPKSSALSCGRLYDDGGPMNNYISMKYEESVQTFLINPCGGSIKLRIDTFGLTRRDYLRVYEGVSANGRPLWDAAKYPLGMTGDIKDTSITRTMTANGAAFVVLHKQKYGNPNLGFSLTWELDTTATVSPPEAISTAPAPICAYKEAWFNSKSKGAYTALEWDLHADGTIEHRGDLFGHTFTKSGRHRVVLWARNTCLGDDSNSAFIKVLALDSPIVPVFAASKRTLYVADTLRLADQTQGCNDSTKWFLQPARYKSAGPWLHVDKEFHVAFADTGHYDVGLIKTNALRSDTAVAQAYIHVVGHCRPRAATREPKSGITRVIIGKIYLTSSATDTTTYTDNSTRSNGVHRGATLPITIETDTIALSRTVWADWNGDGDFYDKKETVLSVPSLKAKSYNDTIGIPRWAKVGRVRLRIAVATDTSLVKPCHIDGSGEFEDYTLYVRSDKTPPSVGLAGKDTIRIAVFGVYTEPGATATDNYDKSLNIKITGSVNTGRLGTYTLTYCATDSSGNGPVCVSRVVLVVDTLSPQIGLVGPDTVTHALGLPFVDLGATATDNYDKYLNIDISGPVDTGRVGAFTLTYCATDSSGNGPVCASRVVLVVDTVSPHIKLLGPDTAYAEQCAAYVDAGYRAGDNGRFRVDTGGTWPGQAYIRGYYTLTYQARDSSGNTSSVARVIWVGDTTAPSLWLLGRAVDTVRRWSAYTDPGAVAGDSCNGKVGVRIERTGDSVETSREDTFHVYYQSIDGSGNRSAKLKRTVLVVTPIGIQGGRSGGGIYLWPNPTEGRVWVQLDGPGDMEVGMRLYGMDGRLVYSQSPASLGRGPRLIDLGALPSGTYRLLVHCGQALYQVNLVRY